MTLDDLAEAHRIQRDIDNIGEALARFENEYRDLMYSHVLNKIDPSDTATLELIRSLYESTKVDVFSALNGRINALEREFAKL